MNTNNTNGNKISITAIIVVILLTLVLFVIGYNLFKTESKRVDDRPAISSVPVEPEPRTISPETEAPSSPSTVGETAPATP